MSDLRPDDDRDRLLRGRFVDLGTAVEPMFPAPPLTELVQGGRRRRLRRTVSLVAAAAAVAALVAAGPVARGLLADGPRAGGTPGGQSSTSALAAVPVGDVVIDLPAWPAEAAQECPATGPVRFARGVATAGGDGYRVSDDLRVGTEHPGAPLVGRLDGLADEVRVVRVECRPPGSDRISKAGLLVLTTGAEGGLRGLGYLGVTSGPGAAFRVPGQVLGPDLKPMLTGVDEISFMGGSIEWIQVSRVGAVPVAQRRVFGWTGDRFQQVAGPTAPPKRLALADVDPRAWVYETPIGGQFGTDMIKCLPGEYVVLEDGDGVLYGVGMAGDGGTCRAGTARLAGQATGSVPGVGGVLLVTVEVLVDGRQPGIFTYAFYDHRGSLVAQTLDARALADPGGNPRLAVQGGDLVVTAATSLGERTFRYRWAGTSFQPVS